MEVAFDIFDNNELKSIYTYCQEKYVLDRQNFINMIEESILESVEDDNIRDVVVDRDFNIRIDLHTDKELYYSNDFKNKVIKSINDRINVRNVNREIDYVKSNLIGNIVYAKIIRSSKYNITAKYEDWIIYVDREKIYHEERLNIGSSSYFLIYGVELDKDLVKVMGERSSTNYVKAVLDRTIPELDKDFISIKHIERVTGYKTKVCLESSGDEINAIKFFVGMKQSRIRNIKMYLPYTEIIEFVQYKEDREEFLTDVLSNKETTFLISEGTEGTVDISTNNPGLIVGRRGIHINFLESIWGCKVNVIDNNTGNEEDDGDGE